MKIKIMFFSIFVLFSLSFAVNVLAETKLADFSLQDLDNKTFRLKDNLGKKIILIDFWATWCKPCIREMVHLEKMYKEFEKNDFVVLGVCCDNTSTVSRVKPFVKANKYSFPILMDTNSSVLELYNPTKTLPYSVLINKEGKIVKIHKGYNDGDEKILREEIMALFPEVPVEPAMLQESDKTDEPTKKE